MNWLDEMAILWSAYADSALVAHATKALAGASPEVIRRVELSLLDDALSVARKGDDRHNEEGLTQRALQLTIVAHKAARDGVGWGPVLNEAHSLWLHAARGPVLRVVDTVRAASPVDLWGRAQDGWDTIRGVSQSPHRLVRASLNAAFNGMHHWSWAEQILTQGLRDRSTRGLAKTASHYTTEVDQRAAALVERHLATVNLLSPVAS